MTLALHPAMAWMGPCIATAARPAGRASAMARWTRLLAPWTELRIDVDPPPHETAADLDVLERRLLGPGAPLRRQCRPLPCAPPGFRFWHRVADGEHFVYIEDVQARRMAGCTVFNRLVEVGRAVDPHVRSPHSRYRPDYQRRGLASAVYRWALDDGLCLLSGARQSPGAHALWHKLGRHYRLEYVQLTAQRHVQPLGSCVDAALRERLDARLMLWAPGVQSLPGTRAATN